ncbi:multicopper oxidase [Patellaria atrata CBS 101060]|uniref:Multicopper oxidase n=1 Tax=Patellaria atrata CBS 101060 TaxID=1346257 RepID=A0A9P4S5J3_9PEZI|nr:multicopper oxidase [Patellaria atrata CBS 101060]
MPDTGVTRTYEFTVSYQTIAPDGVPRKGIVINEQFPGPPIEADWGDWIEVTMHNAIEDEGTALHWHGLLQKGTPTEDGVPGVGQCPTPPNGTQFFKFQADIYGTSWYHSHYSAQYAGGAVGPMIIHGPGEDQYDEDLGPIMLLDWYHKPYYQLVDQTMAPTSEGLPPPVSENALINGLNPYDCSLTDVPCTQLSEFSTFKFTSGKKHRLRLMNTGAEAIHHFSIDGHNMTIIANDFIPVEPYETRFVSLGVGQRTDVIVEGLDDATGAYWMRSDMGPGFKAGGCNLVNENSTLAKAIIYYEDADTTALPTTEAHVDYNSKFCGNDPLYLTTPLEPLTPTLEPSTTQEIHMKLESNGTHTVWKMNGSSYRANYNDPTLLEAKLGSLEFPPEANVHNFGANDSVRLVVYNHWTGGSHPMHMHGHNMFVLAEGYGVWDGSIVNAENPQRRDVQIVNKAQDDDTPAFIVVQFEQDNPGVWPFHCHIAWHVSAGLYINILERPDDIVDLDVPARSAQTCRDWAAWTGQNVPNQIDSGLRMRE